MATAVAATDTTAAHTIRDKDEKPLHDEAETVLDKLAPMENHNIDLVFGNPGEQFLKSNLEVEDTKVKEDSNRATEGEIIFGSSPLLEENNSSSEATERPIKIEQDEETSYILSQDDADAQSSFSENEQKDNRNASNEEIEASGLQQKIEPTSFSKELISVKSEEEELQGESEDKTADSDNTTDKVTQKEKEFSEEMATNDATEENNSLSEATERSSKIEQDNTIDKITLKEKEFYEEIATISSTAETTDKTKRENEETVLPVEPQVGLDKLVPQENEEVEIDNSQEFLKNEVEDIKNAKEGSDETIEGKMTELPFITEENNTLAEPTGKSSKMENEMEQEDEEPSKVLDKDDYDDGGVTSKETSVQSDAVVNSAADLTENLNDNADKSREICDENDITQNVPPMETSFPKDDSSTTNFQGMEAKEQDKTTNIVVGEAYDDKEYEKVDEENCFTETSEIVPMGIQDLSSDTDNAQAVKGIPLSTSATEENGLAKAGSSKVDSEPLDQKHSGFLITEHGEKLTEETEEQASTEAPRGLHKYGNETVEACGVISEIKLQGATEMSKDDADSKSSICENEAEKNINAAQEQIESSGLQQNTEPTTFSKDLISDKSDEEELKGESEDKTSHSEETNDKKTLQEKQLDGEIASITGTAEDMSEAKRENDETLPVESEVLLDKLAPEETNKAEIDNPHESLKNNEEGNDGAVDVEKGIELPSVAKGIEEQNSSEEPSENPIRTEDETPEKLFPEGKNIEDHQDSGIIINRMVPPNESIQEAKESPEVLDNDDDEGTTPENLVQDDAVMNCEADMTKCLKEDGEKSGDVFNENNNTENKLDSKTSLHPNSEVDLESAKASSDTIEDEIVKEETFSQDNKGDQSCTQIENEVTLGEVETEDVQGANYLSGSQLVASEIKETTIDEAAPVAQISESVLQLDMSTNDNDDNHKSKILEKDIVVDSLPQENPEEILSDLITKHEANLPEESEKQASMEELRDDNVTVAVCEATSEVKQQCTAEIPRDDADSKNSTSENEAETSLNASPEEIERSGLQQNPELILREESNKSDDVVLKGEIEDKFFHSENINDGLALQEKQLHDEMGTIADITEGTSGTKIENDDKTLSGEPEVVLNKLVQDDNKFEIDNPQEFLKHNEEGSDGTVEGEKVDELPSVAKAIEEDNTSAEPIESQIKIEDEMAENFISEGENREGQDAGIILHREIPPSETEQEAKEPSKVLDKDEDEGMIPEGIPVQADAVINRAANLKEDGGKSEVCNENDTARNILATQTSFPNNDSRETSFLKMEDKVQEKVLIPEDENMDSVVVESSDDKEYEREKECLPETNEVAPIGIQSQVCTKIEHEITRNDKETESAHGVNDSLGSQLVASNITEPTLDETTPITPKPLDSAFPGEVIIGVLQGEINMNDNDCNNQSKILEKDTIVDGNLSTACIAQENPMEELSDSITEHEGNLTKESEKQASMETPRVLHADDNETVAVCEGISEVQQQCIAEDDTESRNSVCPDEAEENLNADQEEIDSSGLQQNTEPTPLSKELNLEPSNGCFFKGESEDKASCSENTNEGITLQEKQLHEEMSTIADIAEGTSEIKREDDEKISPDEHEVVLDKLVPDEKTKVEIGDPHEILKSNEEGSDGTVEGEKMIEPSVVKNIIEENSRCTEPIETPSKTDNDLPEKLFSDGENREGQDTGIILNRGIPSDESQQEAEDPLKVLEKDDDEDMTPEETIAHAEAAINCPADLTENCPEDGEKSGEVCNENDNVQSILATKTSLSKDDSNETSVQEMEDKEHQNAFNPESKNIDSLAVESHDDDDVKVKKEESSDETRKIPLLETQSLSSESKDAQIVTCSPLSNSPTEETGSEKARSSEMESEPVEERSYTKEDETVKQEVFSHGSSSCQISSQEERSIANDEVETETIQEDNDFLGSQLVASEIKETGLSEGIPVCEKPAGPSPLTEVHERILEGSVHMKENEEDHQGKILEKDNTVDDSISKQEKNISRETEEPASEEELRELHRDQNGTDVVHDIISKDDVDSEKEKLHAACEGTEKESLPQDTEQTVLNEELTSIKDNLVLRGESEDKETHLDYKSETNSQEKNILAVDLDEAKSVLHNENTARDNYSTVDEKSEEQIYTATDIPTEEIKRAYETCKMPGIKVLGDTSVQGQSGLDMISAIHRAEDTVENNNATCLKEVADIENQEDQNKQDGPQRIASKESEHLSEGIENEISKDCICSNTIINKEESLSSSNPTGEARINEEDAMESKEQIKEPVIEAIYHSFQPVENEKIIEVGTIEASKDEDSKMIQDKLLSENSNVEPKNLDASYSTDKEIQGVLMEEAYTETSGLVSEKSDHAIESASEVHKLEMPLEEEKVGMVEENLAETENEEIVIKKTNEENDIVKADISSEQTQTVEHSVIVKSSLGCPEEVLRSGPSQEDELKPEENESEKLGENESIKEEVSTDNKEESHYGNGKEIPEMSTLQEQVKHSIADEKQNEELQSIVDGADSEKALDENEKLDSCTEVQEEVIITEADRSQKTDSSTPSISERVQPIQQELILVTVQPRIQELETEKVSGAPPETELNQTNTNEASTTTSEETSPECEHNKIQSDIIANSQVLAHINNSDNVEDECPLDLKVTNTEQHKCSASESYKAVPTETVLNISTEGSASRVEENQCAEPELQEEIATESLTQEMARDGETKVQQKNLDLSFNIIGSAMESSSTATEQKNFQENIDIIQSAQEHASGHPCELQNDETDPAKIQNDRSTISEEKAFKNEIAEGASNATAEAAGLECREDVKTEVEVNKITERSQTRESATLSDSNLMLGSIEESSQIAEQKETKSQTEKLHDFKDIIQSMRENKTVITSTPKKDGEDPIASTDVNISGDNINASQLPQDKSAETIEFEAELSERKDAKIPCRDGEQRKEETKAASTQIEIEALEQERITKAEAALEENKTSDRVTQNKREEESYPQPTSEGKVVPEPQEDSTGKSHQANDEAIAIEDFVHLSHNMHEEETNPLLATGKLETEPNESTDGSTSTSNANENVQKTTSQYTSTAETQQAASIDEPIASESPIHISQNIQKGEPHPLPASTEQNEKTNGNNSNANEKNSRHVIPTEARDETSKAENQASKAETEEQLAESDREEEELGREHKVEDSGPEAPVVVENAAGDDADSRAAKKKHHNILSGVGSKVKHSIAKVKKVITGKSSPTKQQ